MIANNKINKIKEKFNLVFKAIYLINKIKIKFKIKINKI